MIANISNIVVNDVRQNIKSVLSRHLHCYISRFYSFTFERGKNCCVFLLYSDLSVRTYKRGLFLFVQISERKAMFGGYSPVGRAKALIELLPAMKFTHEWRCENEALSTTLNFSRSKNWSQINLEFKGIARCLNNFDVTSSWGIYDF